ncbi:MAG: hypothetical protein HGA36_03785 [Candidatus Moranbacteria bacterium]|nr:hypothetical protein [Candidatus Moranbacteria bacterium]
MKKQILKIFFLLAIILGLPNFASAAPGDILWQANFDHGTPSDPKSVVLADGGVVWSSLNFNAFTSVPSAGGWDDGSYLHKVHSSAATDYTGSGFSSFHFTPKSEATFVYWERYQSGTTTLWNNKGSRVRDTGNYYYGAIMSQWNLSYDSCLLPGCSTIGPALYMSNDSAGTGGPTSWTLVPTNAVTSIDANAGYCTFLGNNQYACPGRVALHWTTDGGVTENFGENKWHKFRIYSKVPSSNVASDGLIMLWIDDVLVYTLQDISSSLTGGNLLSHIEFYPSETTDGSFVHDYDDIVIYEGYVPPSGTDTVPPSAPTELGVN